MKQIIALGGGGFTTEPDNLQLDEYIIAASGVAKPRICFIGTASGDDQGYIYRFHKALRKYTRRTSALVGTKGMDTIVNKQDIVYIGGGDQRHLLALWQASGLLPVLRGAYERGVILAGICTGPARWFDWALTDTAGMRAEDGVAVHYVNGALHRVVSSHPDAKAWRSGTTPGGVPKETALEPVYLAQPGPIIRRASLGDAAGIHAAHHRSIREIAARDYTAQQVGAWTARALTPEAEASISFQIRHERIWVIEMSGRIEGFLHLRFPTDAPGAAYVHALYLTPSAAGRGLAQRLMSYAEHEARSLDMGRMALHSSKTARGFYNKLGYRGTGPELQHVVMGVGLPCYPMAKDL